MSLEFVFYIKIFYVFHFDRVKEDLQDAASNPLIEIRGETSPGLLHLVVFGRASPYLHNGSMEIKDDTGEVWNQLVRLG